MNGKQVIKAALDSTQQLLKWYVSDLSDADLLVRPVPGANHIAWQLGHLVEAEQMVKAAVPSAKYPELPTDWSKQHNKESAAMDPAKGFATKAEYLDRFTTMRAATIAALDGLSDADLDKPTSGDMAKWAPTIGSLFVLTGNHTLMHAGQFTVLRRKLGKPVLF
jgi:uncharacterized damage-inducible protein DinB